jgi:hypothetical protein
MHFNLASEQSSGRMGCTKRKDRIILHYKNITMLPFSCVSVYISPLITFKKIDACSWHLSVHATKDYASFFLLFIPYRQ